MIWQEPQAHSNWWSQESGLSSEPIFGGRKQVFVDTFLGHTESDRPLASESPEKDPVLEFPRCTVQVSFLGMLAVLCERMIWGICIASILEGPMENFLPGFVFLLLNQNHLKYSLCFVHPLKDASVPLCSEGSKGLSLDPDTEVWREDNPSPCNLMFSSSWHYRLKPSVPGTSSVVSENSGALVVAFLGEGQKCT